MHTILNRGTQKERKKERKKEREIERERDMGTFLDGRYITKACIKMIY